MLKVQGVDHVGLAVKDVRKSVAWYQEMFGLERLYEAEWEDFQGVVGIGDTSVAFFPTDDPDIPCPLVFLFTTSPFAWIKSISARRRKHCEKKESILRFRIIKL